MKKIVLLSIILFSVAISEAQSNIQLAINYFNSKEYDKAEILFDKLYKKNKSSFYFDYYIDCLINQGKYKYAEKRVKKEIKKTPDNLTLYVNLGYLMKQTNQSQESEKYYRYVLKKLPRNQTQISRIGNSFLKRREYDWAEKVYLKGNEFFPNRFTTSLITIYSIERNNNKLIDAYLDFVKNNYSQVGFVERNLKRQMNNDINNEFSKLLERKLIIRIQKQRKEIYNEILIWFYTEKLEYSKALIQAQALDRKNRENGVRIYRIGQNAFENKDYKTAEIAFEDVIKKGEFYPYFINAKFGLLKVLYAKVENGMIKTPEEIKNVESKYLQMIAELGVSSRTIDLIIDLAHLQAFYLNKEPEAIKLLQKGMNIQGINSLLKAKFMMELGDIYLHSAKPWKAVLTYAKIEEDYPNLEITDEAKFKKAKVYFYLGQFKWALQQLDVLKGSPTKLIANDAIYWSDFISENAQDTSNTAMKKYARAELAFYEGKSSDAIAICDSLLKEDATNTVIPFVYYLKYKIYFDKKDFSEAAKNLQTIVSDYSYVMWADKVIFNLALLYENKLNQLDKAKEMYKKLLFDYQASIYSEKARENFKKLLEKNHTVVVP